MSASQAVVVPPGRDADEALALRTFVAGPDGWQQVDGARCRVTGGDYFPRAGRDPCASGPARPRPRCAAAARRLRVRTARGAAVVAPYFPWPAGDVRALAARVVGRRLVVGFPEVGTDALP